MPSYKIWKRKTPFLAQWRMSLGWALRLLAICYHSSWLFPFFDTLAGTGWCSVKLLKCLRFYFKAPQISLWSCWKDAPSASSAHKESIPAYFCSMPAHNLETGPISLQLYLFLLLHFQPLRNINVQYGVDLPFRVPEYHNPLL